MNRPIKIESLKWDSNFFDLRVGEIFLKPNQKIDIGNPDFDLIIVKSISDNLLEIEGFENAFSEVKITYLKVVEAKAIQDYGEIDSVFHVDVKREDLYNIAFESGKFSRFKLDKNIEVENYEKLYKLWIDNTLNKTFADDILVYIDRLDIAGLITYKLVAKSAKVDLFAVSPKKQGQGIGTKLLHSLEQKLYEMQISKIYITTQQINQLACNFYENLGYKIDSQIYIKHYWKL